MNELLSFNTKAYKRHNRPLLFAAMLPSVAAEILFIKEVFFLPPTLLPNTFEFYVFIIGWIAILLFMELVFKGFSIATYRHKMKLRSRNRITLGTDEVIFRFIHTILSRELYIQAKDSGRTPPADIKEFLCYTDYFIRDIDAIKKSVLGTLVVYAKIESVKISEGLIEEYQSVQKGTTKSHVKKVKIKPYFFNMDILHEHLTTLMKANHVIIENG